MLFGFGAPAEKRNIFEVLIKENPELGRRAILMRKFGQEIIEATAGKKIHGTGADPGRHQPEPAVATQGPVPSRRSTRWRTGRWTPSRSRADYTLEHAGTWSSDFAAFPSPYMSLVAVGDGALDLYHGTLRRSTADGTPSSTGSITSDYATNPGRGRALVVLHEVPLPQGSRAREGWYRVGPLARMNTASRSTRRWPMPPGRRADRPIHGRAPHAILPITGRA
jgi:NAD-reducing hydrogenase large subunit